MHPMPFLERKQQMDHNKNRVVLCPNPYRDKDLRYTFEIKAMLEKEGVEVKVCMLYSDDNEKFSSIIKLDDLQQSVQGALLIVTLGGDGTILHTARKLLGCHVPMVGINLGRVGFLAELSPTELTRLIAASQGKFTTSPRMMLKVEIIRKNEVIFEDYCLNEIVFRGTGQAAVSVCVSGDGRKIYEFQGDGIIVATPTGSTAYSLSAGGPIVEPTAENIILTPLCAHVLAVKPFVLTAGRVIQIAGQCIDGKSRGISVDGSALIALSEDDHIRIRKSGYQTFLAHVSYKGFYDIVYEKLGDSR